MERAAGGGWLVWVVLLCLPWACTPFQPARKTSQVSAGPPRLWSFLPPSSRRPSGSPTPSPAPSGSRPDLTQLTLNRVRDCAVANKRDLMRTLRSPELFTRRGRMRVEDLVEQLATANPVSAPVQSSLLDGRWVRYGVFFPVSQSVNISGTQGLQELQRIVPKCFELRKTYAVLGSRPTSYAFALQSVQASLLGFLRFNLPSRTATPVREASILYLDSDLQIRKVGDGFPQIFLKPLGFRGLTPELRAERDALGSPFRFRHRLLAICMTLVDKLTRFLPRRATEDDVDGKSQQGSGRGSMIGSLNWVTEQGPVTDENMLENIRKDAKSVQSSFVVGDLLEGRVRRSDGSPASGGPPSSPPTGKKRRR